MVRLGDLLEENISKESISNNDIVTFVGMQDVSEDATLVTQHIKKNSDVKKGLTYFAKNDVLVAKITPCFENGKGAYLNILETNVGFGSTEFHVLRANEKSDPAYIYQHTKTKAFRAKLEMDMVGTAGHKRVPLSALQNYVLPVKHTKNEQKAIAKALSDVDELIISLEKLIAKKWDIKTATMQQLLTGKKCLSGFGEEWREYAIEEIAEVITGSTPPTNNKSNYGDEYLFVSPADIANKKLIETTIKKLSKSGFSISRVMPRGSVLFTCIGSTIGKLGIANIDLTSNQQINAILPNDKFSSDFLYYLLALLAPQIRAIASEQAVPMINKSEFSEIKIYMPKLDEQEAISLILSDIDEEVEALCIRLNKTKAIKQGMMQELLTGRTRLI